MKAWVCLLAAVLLTLPVNAEETRVAIALHGGAGTIERARMTSQQELTYRKFLDGAIEEGYRQLKAGEPGLDVVVSIIQRMEDSPLFNAGRGSVYTWKAITSLMRRSCMVWCSMQGPLQELKRLNRRLRWREPLWSARRM